ncbi:MAG: histidine phosphatase family protein [Geminicoccaceae bacterium]|nr:histidine phosphatase family protein [Geminicoccaceae bacterium]
MILVRHAESEWNRLFSATRVDPGIRDPALTDVGRDQAGQLVAKIASLGVRQLIASPYRRTLETATTVARALDLPIEIQPLVRERCVFSCDIGTPASELERLWPELDFTGLDELWWGEAEESFASIGERARRFREHAQDRAEASTTAVITHWGFIRAMTGEEVANAACVRLR